MEPLTAMPNQAWEWHCIKAAGGFSSALPVSTPPPKENGGLVRLSDGFDLAELDVLRIVQRLYPSTCCIDAHGPELPATIAHAADDAYDARMRPELCTWRVRGVPKNYRRQDLELALQDHPSLRVPAIDTAYPSSSSKEKNGCTVHTLAADVRPGFHVATVRFSCTPPSLNAGRTQLTVTISRSLSIFSTASRMVDGGTENSDGVESFRLTIDNTFEGLTVLYAPSSGHHLDVLALSGLGSHPFGSFMNKDDGNMWLGDVLPHDMPSARIMIYGYDTTMVSSTSFADLGALASSLHLSLCQLLQPHEKTPIVLVAHSLGGLLVKEAMGRMLGSETLLKRVAAVLFFGVPHDGIDVTSLIPMVQGQANNSLLNSIDRVHSQVLTIQKQSFQRVLQTSRKLELYCFYETLLSPTAKKGTDGRYRMDGPLACLVATSSATGCLPNGSCSEAAFAIPRTHSELVKFWFNDVEYDKVRYILSVVEQRHSEHPRQGALAHLEMKPLTKDERERFVKMLRFDQAHARQMTIETAQAKTCSWLPETSQYKSWLSEEAHVENGFFWIKGHPGTGKSTIMKYILTECRSSLGVTTTIVAHFFNARGVELEHSSMGLYQSLLVQFFNAMPFAMDSIDLLLHEHSLSLLDVEQVLSNTKPLWLLKSLLEKAIGMLAGYRLLCFVDALDECDTYDVRDMILFFRQLGEVASSKGIYLRVCFASRHYPHINIESGLELVLDEHQGHIQDITTYINSVLDIGKSKTAIAIKEEVQAKARGIFMWVVLVVNILNQEYNGDMGSLEEKLGELPTGLNELFQGIISRDERKHEQFLLCIQWILFARQILDPLGLAAAIQLGTGAGRIQLTTVEDVNIFIINSSKGLAQITKGGMPTVQFIHQSVPDYFIHGNGHRQVWTGSSEEFRAFSHNQIAFCCYRCLVLGTEPPTYSFDPLYGNSQRGFHSLQTYMINHILGHVNEAQGGGIPQEWFLAHFPWELYTHRRRDRLKPSGAGKEYIYALDDLNHLILASPTHVPYLLTTKEEFGPPVLAAFLHGNTRAFQAICRLCRRNINKNLEHIQLPSVDLSRVRDQVSYSRSRLEISPESSAYFYSYFAELGDDNVCLMALKSGVVAMNQKDDKGRSVLSLSTLWGRVGVVYAILDYMTPLWTSKLLNLVNFIGGSRIRPVDDFALMRAYVDINAKDYYGMTALAYACRENHESIVQRFVADDLAYPNCVDRDGRTPLHYCCVPDERGSFDETDLVLPNPDTNGVRGIQRRSFAERRLRIIKMLLNMRGINPDIKDRWGKTPFLLAAEAGAKPSVMALCETGKVNPRSVDLQGRTPLDYLRDAGIEANFI